MKIIRSPFVSLLLTAFIDVTGLGLIIPILAAIFFAENGTFVSTYALETRNLLFGLTIAAYPFAQFFGSPILGDLSDKYGRKKLLVISILGTFVSYLIIAFGVMWGNIGLIFAGRLADGFTGGNLSVVHSAIADISTKDNKTKKFGMFGMMFGLGIILGPVLGGILSDSSLVSWFSFSTPFFFGAILTLINLLLIILNLKETLKKQGKARLSLLTGLKNLARAFTFSELRLILIVVFLFALGFNFFNQFFQVYLIETFSFSTLQIGLLYGYVGLWVAITQGIIIRIFGTKLKSAQILRFSLLGVALTIPLLLLPEKFFYLYLITPLIAISYGYSQPNLMTTVSNMADDDTQGEMLGINQSLQSAAQTIPPVLAGVVSSIQLELPTITSGVILFLAWITFLVFKHKNSKQKLHDHSN